jgi:putative glutamine amidotransferase
MRIGLTYTGSVHKHENYVRWLQSSNHHVEVITLSQDQNNLQKLLTCDGLVLSGGVDIHPSFYGGKIHYENCPNEFDIARDEFEIACFHLAQKNYIPVLGICRGLQLINCILGGTLKQDLASLNENHKALITDKQIDKTHPINIQKDAYLYKLNRNVEHAKVNSAHHQSVDVIAPDLISTCQSPDNVIEGLEWKDKIGKPFLLCVQWHPERMFQFGLQSTPMAEGVKNLFLKFCNLQAIKL